MEAGNILVRVWGGREGHANEDEDKNEHEVEGENSWGKKRRSVEYYGTELECEVEVAKNTMENR